MRLITSAIKVAAAVACAASGPAYAQAGEFGRNSVEGVLVEAPPNVLFSDPHVLSSERLCREIAGAYPYFDDLIAQLIGYANGRLRGSGLQLYDQRTTYGACRAQAYVGGTGDDQSLVLAITLPGNRLDFRSRLPGPNHRDDDPALYTTFDATARFVIPLPRPGSVCLGAPQVSGRVSNIQLPRGQNTLGDVAEFVADIGSSIVDYFEQGIIGRTLASGFGHGVSMPTSLVRTINSRICNGNAVFRSARIRPHPDQLIIQVGGGAQAADNRCDPGFVWREANPRDVVCVTPERRTLVRRENVEHRQRVQPGPTCRPGLFCPFIVGQPRNCLSGFVWREATPDDAICVTPASRQVVREENFRARRSGVVN